MRRLIHNLEKIRCDLKCELELWVSFFLRTIPGDTGVRLRRIFFVRKFGSCGEKPFILEGFKVDNPKTLFLGNNFRSNRGCYINAGGTVRIGNNVLLGPDVKIWSVNHNIEDPLIPIQEQGYRYAQTIIEDNVWIGANVFIGAGVRVGKSSVVAAGTVLTKSVPPYSVVMGNPGKVVKTRQNEYEIPTVVEKMETR